MDSPDDQYRHLEAVLAAYAAAPRGDPRRARLRERLVTSYLPVSRHIARRYAQRGEPLEDLEQVACLGLLNAVDRYDPELGCHFVSYAVPTIRGEVLRHFRDRTWSTQVPRRLKERHLEITGVVAELSQRLGRAPRPSDIAAALDMPVEQVWEAMTASQAYRAGSLNELLGSDAAEATHRDVLGGPDVGIERFVNSYALAPHLAALPARERDIVIMRFYQCLTQTQIADHLGVSQMHVSRLLSKILTHLRDAVEHGDPSASTARSVPPRPGGRGPGRQPPVHAARLTCCASTLGLPVLSNGAVASGPPFDAVDPRTHHEHTCASPHRVAG